MNQGENTIWSLLIDKIKNPFGVAGLMGNLMAESSMNPACTTPVVTSRDYINDIKRCEITSQEFAHDNVAFGLAQWRYWTRKEELIRFAGHEHIDHPIYQTWFLLKEIKSYKTVWDTLLNATSVKEASDIVMLRYEKPANTSDAAKEKRAAYGQMYYDQFAGQQQSEYVVKKYVKAKTQVNIRVTPDKLQPRLGELRKGQTAELISTENGWHKIGVWVSGDYVDVIGVLQR